MDRKHKYHCQDCGRFLAKGETVWCKRCDDSYMLERARLETQDEPKELSGQDSNKGRGQ